MYYKRKESFRYTFGTPIQGSVKKLDQNEKIDMHVLDLSPKGAKIKIEFSEIWSKDTLVTIEFTLIDNLIKVNGSIKWAKTYGSTILYGLDLHTSDIDKNTIVNSIKHIVRKGL